MSDARTEILQRIRAANSAAGVDSRPSPEIDRSYRHTEPRERSALLAQLEERLLDYTATVVHTTAPELRVTLHRVLNDLNLRRIAIPSSATFTSALPEGFEFISDDGLTTADLDRVDAVLTGCTCAIAETGTLVLQAGADTGRRALTLVPDIHVCIVPTIKVLATVPEAFDLLASTNTLPTTFISGPSATADIEMTRVKGVHGPRFLHVVLLHDSQ